MPRGKKEERWVSAREATKILEEKAGRPIARNYIGILVKLGKVEARPIDGRTNEYKANDVENYVVKPRSKQKTVESPSMEGEAA